MNFKDYIKDKVIFIVPNDFKTDLLKIINKEDSLYDIKIYSLTDLKTKLLFTYDEKTMFYLMKNYNMSYSYAKDVLNNIYKISFDEENNNLKFFLDIKKDLIKNNLIIYDKYFLNTFKNYKVYVYGFNYIYKFDQKLLDIINTSSKINYIKEEEKNYEHNILSFNNINEEIEYIANDIIKNINDGININNIYLTNLNSDYTSTIKRVFNFYNIPVNLNEKTSLYDISSSKELLNNLDNPNNYLNNIKNIEIKNKCIDVLNKYYFIDDLNSIKEIITSEFKNSYLNNQLYKDAINVIDIKNNIINDDMFVYMLGFAEDYIPILYKDEELINDKIKPPYIESTYELNAIETKILSKIIKKAKNLTISFSKRNLTDNLIISSLSKSLNIIEKEYNISCYSHKSNLHNLTLYLDDFIKYGEKNKLLDKLYYNYNNINYLKYDNSYNLIDPKLIKKQLNGRLNLSYSKLNIYHQCSFRYYLECILKINIYEEIFEGYLGSLIHYILSKIYEKDFNLEKEKEKFLKENKFDLTPANKLFLNVFIEDLKDIIDYILSFNDETLFKEVEQERVVTIENKIDDVTLNFTGIIDKIIKYNNDIAIIDYKSGEANIDLSLIPYGLNMQLPIYMYLTKNIHPNANIIGIYLQEVKRNLINFELNKDIEKTKKDNLKLIGYTINDHSSIKNLDPTYQNSKYIKGLKIKNDGDFYAYSKLLDKEEFEKLCDIADKTIKQTATNILNAKFDINPKIINNKNESCAYCKYKSICFANPNNYIYLNKDNNLSYLRGEKMKWTNEQLDAINKTGTNILVSAGAGSGKTAVLTERVITKLKSGTHINNLLILTFTNNAASEMKTRIKKEIEKIPELNEQIKYIESSDIKTFDAFVLSLVRKYYYLLNIEKDINIIDASILLIKKKEFLNDIFNEMYEKNDKIFNDFIVTFSIKNDNNIKELIINLDNKFNLITDKKEFLNSYIQNYYKEENINNLFDEYVNLIKKRIETIKNCLNNLSNETDEDYYQNIYTILDLLLKSNTYEEISNNLRLDIPNLPKNSSDSAKYYKSSIKDNLNEIEAMTIFTKEELIQDVLNSKEYAEIIINIIIKLNDKLNNYKNKINFFEYHDISNLAIKLLKENSNIRKEVAGKYEEIMIDEYQDTNDVQEEFISLIENNNVYAVGDIKQSIYRFRNANPYIFKKKYDLYKENKNGIKIDLNKNFRSRKEVLEDINTIFNPIMDEEIGNASYKEEHQLQFGNDSYEKEGKNDYNNHLEILNYEKVKGNSNAEIEAFLIAEDIKNKVNSKYLVYDSEKGLVPCSYKDFTILIDRTTSFDIYKKVFNYYKIPITLFKDENILHNDETYLIKNIITLIFKIKKSNFDNEFKSSFISIARSYLYNLNDEEIFKIITENTYKNTDIFIKGQELSLKTDSLSNEELIEKIIYEFDFYSKIITVGDIKYREIILNNLIKKGQELNKVGITSDKLPDYFNMLIENKNEITLSAIPSTGNSVTLTNTHKSKGLQYSFCYYSGLSALFQLKDPSDRFTYSEKYGLLVPIYKNGIKKPFTFDLYKEEYYKEDISERLRLFYVALTRCKEKMIILTSIDEQKLLDINNDKVDYITKISYRSFQDVLISIYNQIHKYFIPTEVPNIDPNYKTFQKEKLNKDIKDEKIIVNEIEFSKELLTSTRFSKSERKLYSKEDKHNINEGLRIHAFLENIDFKTPNLNTLSEDEIKIIKNLLSHSLFKDIHLATIYKEFEFLNEKEDKIEHGIIDLMLSYDDHIDIVDYKLKNTKDKAYIDQISGYRKYIEEKTKKKTTTYLYSITNNELVKID